jgi:hypothetical protein
MHGAQVGEPEAVAADDPWLDHQALGGRVRRDQVADQPRRGREAQAAIVEHHERGHGGTDEMRRLRAVGRRGVRGHVDAQFQHDLAHQAEVQVLGGAQRVELPLDRVGLLRMRWGSMGTRGAQA